MLSLRNQVSIPAAGIANIVTGPIQFLPWSAAVKFWYSQAATGIELDILIGDIVVSNTVTPNVRAGLQILDNEDMVGSSAARESKQVIVRAVNTTGGAIIIAQKIVATQIA